MKISKVNEVYLELEVNEDGIQQAEELAGGYAEIEEYVKARLWLRVAREIRRYLQGEIQNIRFKI